MNFLQAITVGEYLSLVVQHDSGKPCKGRGNTLCSQPIDPEFRRSRGTFCWYGILKVLGDKGWKHGKLLYWCFSSVKCLEIQHHSAVYGFVPSWHLQPFRFLRKGIYSTMLRRHKIIGERRSYVRRGVRSLQDKTLAALKKHLRFCCPYPWLRLATPTVLRTDRWSWVFENVSHLSALSECSWPIS